MTTTTQALININELVLEFVDDSLTNFQRYANELTGGDDAVINHDPNEVTGAEGTPINRDPNEFYDPLTNPNSVVMDDILTGNSGKDIFILTEGEDLITNFNRGEGDKISLQNFSGLIGLRKVINTDDIEILLDGDNVTTVQDVDGDFFFHTLFVDSEDNQFIYHDFSPVLFSATTGP